MSTAHLKGPGLNSFFAESLVKDAGPLRALEKTKGPMKTEVRKVLRACREEALEWSKHNNLTPSQREAFQALQIERDALLWAFRQVMRLRTYSEMGAITGLLPKEQTDLVWFLHEGLKDEARWIDPPRKGDV